MSRIIRDKNKSIHKLEGFGPVYCINLDDHVERWEYMQDQFDYWNIKESIFREIKIDIEDNFKGGSIENDLTIKNLAKRYISTNFI